MKFKAVSLTDKGNFRKNNQDFIGYRENKFGQFFAVVCDGMGGHASGEIASKIACENLLSLFEQEDFSKFSKNKIDKWFRLAIMASKKKMEDYAFSHPDSLDMGTTLTALLITEIGAFVVNVGDSRTYKIVDHKLHQVTIDQNLLNEEFSAKEEQKLKKKSESLGLNLNEITYWKILVSALGPTKNLKIDTFYLKKPEGKYLLTTDGVHDYIDVDETYQILTKKEKTKNQAKALVEIAKMNLSKDNLSLIIVEVE